MSKATNTFQERMMTATDRFSNREIGAVRFIITYETNLILGALREAIR